MDPEDSEITIENEEALRFHELKRSYKLSEIGDGCVGQLSTYVHSRKFTIDHITSKGVWRFLVIDNIDKERVDGAFLYVFNQATCAEDRFFELDAVRDILVGRSKEKRVIFAYTPDSIKKREKFEKKSRDVLKVIYPQGPFNDIRWRKGSKTLRDEIKVIVQDKEFQKLMDDASVVFKSEQHEKFNDALFDSSIVLDNLYQYDINLLSNVGESNEALYDLFVILISKADELLNNEEIEAEVIKLARSKDVFTVHLPVPHYKSIKTHMDNALKVVELLESREKGERCLTRVISIYGGSNKTDLLSILPIEESPENHASSSGPASSALSFLSTDAKNQADVRNLEIDRVLLADLKSKNEVALTRDEIKRSYKLSEIDGFRVSDLSKYVHNREFTVDHIISKAVWRFLVIDNMDKERVDGAFLYVCNQVTFLN